MLGEECLYNGRVRDISSDKYMPIVAFKFYQIMEAASIGEGVDIKYRLSVTAEPVLHEIAADKASTAGDQKHDYSSLVHWRPFVKMPDRYWPCLRCRWRVRR